MDHHWRDLLRAAHAGDLEVVQEALEADPDYATHAVEGGRGRGGLERTLLIEAARGGRPRLVRHLLDEERVVVVADVNAQDSFGHTPLYYAAEQGKPTCVRDLLEAGAHPGMCDYAGWTPLMVAACNGRVRSMTLLLERSQELLLLLLLQQRRQQQPREAARRKKDDDEDEEEEEGGRAAMAMLHVDATNGMGRSALWLACSNGFTRAAQLLLIKGGAAVPGPADRVLGLTAQGIALRNGHHETVQLLQWAEGRERVLLLSKARAIARLEHIMAIQDQQHHQEEEQDDDEDGGRLSMAGAAGEAAASMVVSARLEAGCPLPRLVMEEEEEEEEPLQQEGEGGGVVRRPPSLLRAPSAAGSSHDGEGDDDEDEEERQAVCQWFVTSRALHDDALYMGLAQGLAGAQPPSTASP